MNVYIENTSYFQFDIFLIYSQCKVLIKILIYFETYFIIFPEQNHFKNFKLMPGDEKFHPNISI